MHLEKRRRGCVPQQSYPSLREERITGHTPRKMARDTVSGSDDKAQHSDVNETDTSKKKRRYFGSTSDLLVWWATRLEIKGHENVEMNEGLD